MLGSPRSAADAWLTAARPGYCGITGIGAKDSACAGPCHHRQLGCKGTFNLPAKAVTWQGAVRACLRLCSMCERCHVISVSLKFKDCSWFENCDTRRLSNSVPGFKSAMVVNSSGWKQHHYGAQRKPRADLFALGSHSHRNEVSRRHAQLLDFAAAAEYNVSKVENLLRHKRLRHQITNGIHLHPDGRRWSPYEFRSHMNGIYVIHNRQSPRDRIRLARKWSQTLLGKVDVWALLHLLHFTIDHTDGRLMYTSQFIHCLQVYATVKSDPMPERDDAYRRDMRIAALVHDMGKLLTVFGEEDGNVDCMNRVIDPMEPQLQRGLDGLEVQWNHDEFGFMKLHRYLPSRVTDVLRYHSLREIPYIVSPHYVNTSSAVDMNDPSVHEQRLLVTHEEVAAIVARMDLSDVERAKFVAHFAYFDRDSKLETDEIPVVDVAEVRTLIAAYFPGGLVEW